ncbi:MAG: hypothetical protein HKN79_07680 [Flavobacteriales bacterium]|nr:hypothetical protein [Flavobacteriales bacterium]
MELIESLHAVAGFVVALTGLAQIVTKKGGIYHAVVGFTYLSAWLIVVVTGGYLGSPLITLFGFLGFYMALTGWRFANRRRTRPKTPEKVIYWIGLIVATSTFIWGLSLAFQGHWMGIVALIFGAIFLITCIVDILDFIFKKNIRRLSASRKQWMFEHMTRMYISYIAAMTAFAVINEIFITPIYNWLMPTVVGTILIFFTRRQQEKKLLLREEKERG